MTVEIHYWGGFGNNIFQYICARLFAIRNNLQLNTVFPHTEVFTPAPPERGAVISNPSILLEEGADVFSTGHKPPAKYTFKGFFQNGPWYHERKDAILKLLRPIQTITKKNTKDIVAHLRMGDYLSYEWAVHPKWFLPILEDEKFERLYIVTDQPVARYLEHFRKFNPTIIHGSMKDDWNFIRNFDRIICPNSSFSWWAAFFSEASKVYTHKRWLKKVPTANLSWFPNGIQVDGPFIDEAIW